VKTKPSDVFRSASSDVKRGGVFQLGRGVFSGVTWECGAQVKTADTRHRNDAQLMASLLA
jgi:hypothetical protein